MPESPKILFVVEGSTDAKLVNRIRELFNCSAAIYTINANIYALYLKVKDDPYADTLQVLKEMRNSESDKRILDQTYTDIFLVFDCDPQHTFGREEPGSLSLEERFSRNMKIVQKMVERFDESTDPQRGKLLVNYPMVESFRDCDQFFDPNYADAEVAIKDVAGYKRHVASKGLVRFHVENYEMTDMLSLIRQNICKLNKISGGEFIVPSYDDFLTQSNQAAISELESAMVDERKVISVLNTLLFFPIDYNGAKQYQAFVGF